MYTRGSGGEGRAGAPDGDLLVNINVENHKFFKKKFPGKILYAVKTNPNPFVLKTLIESGIKNFDVCSCSSFFIEKKNH